LVIISYQLPPPPTNIDAPTISGTGNPGLALTCNTSAGDWNGSPSGFLYKFANGSTILQGPSDDQFYVLGVSDVGESVTCLAAAYNGGGTSAYVPSSNSILVTNPLTVTAKNASMTYGGAYPALSATFTGLVKSDTQANQNANTVCTSTAMANSPVGAYPINCVYSNDGFYGPISYVAGTLTIKAAPLTVTANNASMTYGGTYPTFGATYSGLVNGDTMGKESGLTTCTSAPANSVPGHYPINCKDTDANYGPITYNAGTLTINKAPTMFTISEVVSGTNPIKDVLSESGLPPGAVGYVTFNASPTFGCMIYLTGQPGEATSCTDTFPASQLPHSISASFVDSDGDYLNSTSSNTVSPHV
jgi:hypothetical protein